MIRIMKIFAIVFFAFAPALQSSQEPKPAVPPTAQPGEAVGDNPVVARVAGESITEKEVLRMIAQMASRQQLPPEQARQKDVLLFNDAVETLVGRVLLKNEGNEKKVIADKAKVDESFQDLVKRFPSEEQFKKALEMKGISEADLRASIEENVFFQQVIDLALHDLPGPTDADVQKFYDDNPQYFAVSDQVRASHILLKVDPKGSVEQKAEIKKKLEALREEIDTKKVSFAEAATKNSQDEASARNGGDLGFFSRGQLVKPFEEFAFSAKPGTLSPVVETQFGFHLINVVDNKPAGKKALEEVKDQIQGFLGQKSKDENLKKHIGELRAKATVETVMTEEAWKSRRTSK